MRRTPDIRGSIARRIEPEVAIIATLAGALFFSAWMTVHAYRADLLHQRTAEGALADYAGFASWELSRRVGVALERSLDELLVGGLMSAHNARLVEPGATPAVLLTAFTAGIQRGLVRCECPDAADSFFLVDPVSTPSVEMVGDPDSELAAWVASVLLPGMQSGTISLAERQRDDPSDAARPRPAGTLVRLRPPEIHVLEHPAHTDVKVIYALVEEPDGTDVVAMGFTLDLEPFTARLLEKRSRESALLPPSLTEGRDNEEILDLTIQTIQGRQLFRMVSPHPGGSTASDTVEARLATLVTSARIPAAMAEQLIIGGIPAASLPARLAPFLLTLVLFVVAFTQVRRQRVLARLRRDFIAGVSHELRTPLTQIRLFGELLESGRLREEQSKRSVRIINDEAERLTYLVENILQFSRLQNDQQRIQPTPERIDTIVHETVEAFTPLAEAHGASLVTLIRATPTASIDRNALRQILLNLLDNAVKYGPRPHTITVGVDIQGDRVRIWVEDEGPGIPPAERENIWEPYHRLARDRDSARGGSGIGLAVVRQLVLLQGGNVTVEDGASGGARFLLDFPIRVGGGSAPGKPSRRRPDPIHHGSSV
jgi:signal transduction histidine kinase